MHEQKRTTTMGHTLTREDPDHRAHVGTQYAGGCAVCRYQVSAKGYPSTVAGYCGPKGE